MKGFVKILEVVIAAVILIAAMNAFFIRPELERPYISDLEKRTESALAVLDRVGGLETYLSENRPDLLDANLTEMLPVSVGFSVNVTDSDTRKFIERDEGKIKATVFYITSKPQPTTMVVYLWEVF
jgi:hypothetical protein